jgi:glycyl-tRNA synthetase beta chain
LVGEFPELQGIMGGYYARAQGFEPAVCDAIRDHYRPVGPSDSVPTTPVTVAVALADKLDTLVGFFAIDEKPTGSKDPYALRRSALGVIRLVLAQAIRLQFKPGLRQQAFRLYDWHGFKDRDDGFTGEVPLVIVDGITPQRRSSKRVEAVVLDLLAFFADRLKVLLRDEGKRHDLVDAVFALGDDDLVRIVRRVDALTDFLATEDGANLLAGYKRATNILKAEEKKHPAEAELYRLNADLGALTTPEEAALAAALRVEVDAVDQALEAEDFTRALQHLAHLRAPVDAFFDTVMVNDPEPEVRLTRLRLLTQVRDTANRVADFSLISG